LFAQRFRRFRLWGLAGVAATQIALADIPPEVPPSCEVSGAQEAMALADRLFEKGEYQHAGACYEVAGDMGRANVAFLRAVGPKSEDSARAFRQQRDQAKALFGSVERAFRSDH
jgi:hypothetical protein